jgi:Ca2+-binding RTX toxin-like protein
VFLFGGDGDDRVRSTTTSYLSGGAGDDRLVGSVQADLFDGGRGEDVLRAGAGSDEVYGGFGIDRAYGGLGDDCFSGSARAATADGDLIDGGPGLDEASYGGSVVEPIRVDLSDREPMGARARTTSCAPSMARSVVRATPY